MCLSVILTRGCILAAFCSPAAQPDSRAHQHGVARLELLKQASDLHITLYATGMDLLGFEQQPQTASDRDTINKVSALLSAPDKLFQIEGAKCSPVTQQSNLTELPKKLLSAHSHKQADDHEHGHSTYSDIETTYHFSCSASHTPIQVQVQLFSLFPALLRIDTSWITEQGQSAARLTPAKPQLRLN